MKLSPVQQRVVDLMRDGWELGVSTSLSSRRTWLQKDGIGRGGETEDVNGNTFCALCERGIIREIKRGWPSSTWGLTAQWRTANAD